MQVINVLLKKGMSFNRCVHSTFWPTVYMFKRLLFNNLSTFLTFSPMWGPDGFSPEKSVKSCAVKSSPDTWDVCGCFSTARMCSDCGSLFIMWFCLLPFSALSEMNNYGKLMPFGYFLRRIASCNLILFFFLTCTKNVGSHCCPVTEMILINLNDK